MVTTNWWGIRIRLSREQTQSLLKLLGSGAAIDGLLLAVGVPLQLTGVVIAAITLAALWIAGSDDGNGVALNVTWAAWLWIDNPPPGA
jgi:hypothetical protein